MTATSNVEATCFVQSNFKAKVTWQMDGRAASDTETKENGTHLVSTLTVSPGEWKTLKRVTCKAEHLCFSASEKTVNVPGSQVTPRSTVNIRRSLSGLQKEEVVLLCDVTKQSGDFYISVQDDKGYVSDKLYVYLPEAAGLQTVSREFTVPSASSVKGRRFFCTVNQGFSDSINSSHISFVVDPRVDIFVPSKESGPQRLVCSGSSLNPKIQWISGLTQIPSSLNSKSMGADGRVTVTSQLEISQTEWKTGKNYTCVLSDKSLGDNVKKHINYCSASPTSSQFVNIYVQGPGAEEIPKDAQVTITCLLLGSELKDFSITWKVNGRTHRENTHTKQPVSHSNGTETLQSFLNISAKDWEAFRKVACEAKHICSKQSYKDHIKKSKAIYSEPSVTLLQGPHELVCLATGFSPSSINISWFLEKQHLSSYNTTEPHAGQNGMFSIQSHLNLTHFVWLPRKMITCNVTHGNTTFILNVTKSDALEKCLFLDEILQAEVYQDISVDSWHTTVTFLLLFLMAVFYSVGVTLVKTK